MVAGKNEWKGWDPLQWLTIGLHFELNIKVYKEVWFNNGVILKSSTYS